MTLRVLAVYGHPDDEGQVAGTLARLIERGAEATLLCATRGEVGEISDPSLATPETLGWVRELELRAAMARLRVWDIRFLPYRDSGMAGTPENDDPRCLHQALEADVVGQIVALMREVRPHVVFTWDPTGGYGHPDHLAAHRHTFAAFDIAADASRFPEAGAPWEPQRLYWGAFTMKRFASMFFELERRGLLPEAIEPERRARMEQAMAEPDPDISLVHNTSDLADLKRMAASMHRSQFGESSMFARIPDDLRAQFFAEERFYQARPAWPAGAPPEEGLDGLFALARG